MFTHTSGARSNSFEFSCISRFAGGGSAFIRGGWLAVVAHLRLFLSSCVTCEPEPAVAIVPGVPRDDVDGHPARPVLVIEVADSSLRFDRRQKSRLYARAGLAEYWIVNIVDHALEIYREPERETDEREDWTYRSVDALRPPATVTPLAAPHARIAVADLLP